MQVNADYQSPNGAMGGKVGVQPGQKNDIMDMYAKEFDAQHKLAQFRTSGQPLLVIQTF